MCLLVLCILTGCDNNEKNADAVQGDEVLLSDANASFLASKNDEPEEESEYTNDKELSAEIMNMAVLCDAINRTIVDNCKEYNENEPEFVWECVNLALSQADRQSGKIEDFGKNQIKVDPDIVNEYLFAMFGNLSQPPAMSVTSASGSGSKGFGAAFDQDLNYIFDVKDRGLTTYKVVGAKEESDMSVCLQVELLDTQTNSEIGCFTYNMRSNTRDTSLGADFNYEIVSCTPTDLITRKRITGKPYYSYLSRKYPLTDSGSDKNVEEILGFSIYGSISDELKELNGNIINDNFSIEGNGYKWHKILSYPVDSNDYYQILISFTGYPQTGDDTVIRTYNYDAAYDRVISRQEALNKKALTEVGLENLAVERFLRANDKAEVTGCEYVGFIVRQNDSLDYYLKLYVDEGDGKEYTQFVSYNSDSRSLTIYGEGDDYVDGAEEAVMNPKLTHGRTEE